MLRRPAFQPGDKVITGNEFSLVAGLGRSGGELPNPGRFAAPLCGKMACESQQQRDGIFPSTTQPREPKGRPPPPARQSDENGRLRIAPGEAPKRTSITLPVRRASKSAAWEGSRAWPPDHHLPNGNLTLFPQLLLYEAAAPPREAGSVRAGSRPMAAGTAQRACARRPGDLIWKAP